jgi:hypothetical protein
MYKADGKRRIDREEAVLRLSAEGHGRAAIARQLGVSRRQVYRILAEPATAQNKRATVRAEFKAYGSRGPRVIAVANQKGGVGKTTTRCSSSISTRRATPRPVSGSIRFFVWVNKRDHWLSGQADMPAGHCAVHLANNARGWVGGG